MPRKKNEKIINKIDYELLLQIVDNTFGNIFVTDKDGIVIFVNQNTAQAFNMDRDDIIGVPAKELVDRGVISKSTSLEALEKKDIAIGVVNTQMGYQLLNFSKPILDENGEPSIVVTFGQHEYLMQQIMEEIEKEKKRSEAYKEALMRIGGFKSGESDLIIESPVMKSLYAKIDRVADTESTILLYGESGVGKDYIASHIHRISRRSTEPFVPINCAAIPRELIESELFGYDRGAFTGASAQGKAGFFELANNGTLFLDEIGELPMDVQAKFLRVIETGEITRVGGQKPIRTNVRLISATNRDLPEMIRENKFREDLFFRLNVISFKVPPLRERKDDIPALCDYFLQIYNRKYAENKFFSGAAMEELKRYPWKGNVRELRNVIERLVITSDEDELKPENVPELQSIPPLSKKIEEYMTGSLGDVFAKEEKKKVLEVLLSVNGNKTKAAQILGISKGKLYRLLE